MTMTPICEISNGGVTTYRWLCARHMSDRRGSWWSVKPTGWGAQWPCDDCFSVLATRVDFVPTAELSRLPTRKEYQRPCQPETWAARLARLRKQQEAA